MKRVGLGLGALVFFLGMTALLVRVQGGVAAADSGKRATHLHCPECFLEIRYRADFDGKSCARCGTGGPKLVATAEPVTGPGASPRIGPLGRTLVAALASGVLVLVLAYGWVLWDGSRRRAEEELKNRPLVCQCPFCSRRIGYPTHKVGDGALCPRCKTAFTLPEDEAIDEEALSGN